MSPGLMPDALKAKTAWIHDADGKGYFDLVIRCAKTNALVNVVTLSSANVWFTDQGYYPACDGTGRWVRS